MAGTAGFNATLKVTGTSTAFTTEDMVEKPGTTSPRTVYRIVDALKRVWDPEQAISVQADEGGGYAPVPSSDYTVEALDGTITFATSLAVGATVQVSGYYLPLLSVLQASEVSLELARALLEDTTLGDGARTRVAGMLDATGTFSSFSSIHERYDIGDAASATSAWITGGTPKVLEFSPAGSSTHLVRAWVLLETGEESSPVEDLLTSSISFTLSSRKLTGRSELASIALVTW